MSDYSHHAAPSQRVSAPPSGVLAADLARPISVRDLAQSRVPAVPPPYANANPTYLSQTHARDGGASSANGARAQAVPPPRPSSGFAGFGVPRSPVVYAATSGLLPNWPSSYTSSFGADATLPPELSTHGEASDLTSLAHRDIDRLGYDDLYNYASHLQDAAKRYSGHLSEAYAKRDAYRSKVAELNHQLQEEYLKTDLLRRNREKADDALQQLREDNTQLRQLLATAEGQAHNLTAKLSLHNGADASVVIRSLQAQLKSKEEQLRTMSGRLAHASAEHERAVAALQREQLELQHRLSHSSSTEGGANPRPSNAFGAADTDLDNTQAAPPQREAQQEGGEGGDVFRPEIEERVRREVAETVEQAIAAATAHLRAELADLQQRHDALQMQLTAEATAHAAALGRAAAQRAEMMDAMELLKQEKAELQANEDELVTALTLRAPVSKADFEAFQATYAALQTQLRAAEANAATLQEQHQTTTAAREDYLAVLQASLATSQEERQRLQEANDQLQALVNNLQTESEVASAAIRLQQEQVASQLQQAQSRADLQARCDALENEVRRLQADRDQWDREALAPLTQPAQSTGTNNSNNNNDHADSGAVVSEEMAANMAREKAELEAEMETLRNSRDSLVVSRDSLVKEVRDLEEQRQQQQQHEETVREHADVAAASSAQMAHDAEVDMATLRAAQECITNLQRDLEAANADLAKREADAQTQLTTLMQKLSDQEELIKAAMVHQTETAAAQKYTDEVIAALKEELELTQARDHELRESESAYKARYAAESRVSEQLRERVAELEKQVSIATESTAAAVAATSALNEQQSSTAATSAALDKLAEQLTDAEDRVARVESEKRQLADALERAKRAVVVMEEHSSSNSSSAAATQQAAESAKAEAERSSAQQVAELTAERDAALHEAAQAQATRAAIEAQISTAVHELAAAQQRASATAEELRTAQAALETMANALADATQRVETATSRTAELEGEVAQLSAARDAAAEKLSAATAALERVADEAAALKERVDSLTGANVQLTAEVDAKERRLRAAENDTRTLQSALEKLAEESAAVAQPAAALTALNANLEAASASAAVELAAARSTIDCLTAERDALRSTVEELQVRVNSAENAQAEQSAQQQRGLEAAKEELRVAQAALTKLADDLTHAAQRGEALADANAALETKTAQQASELQRVLHAVAQSISHIHGVAHAVDPINADTTSVLQELSSSIAFLVAEGARMKTELSVAQGAVASLADENNQNSDVDAELKRQLDAMTQARDAAQQRAAASAEELCTAAAALDRMVAESSAQAQQTANLSERVAQLETEKAQLSAARDAAEQQASTATAQEVSAAKTAFESAKATELASFTHRYDELVAAASQMQAERDAAKLKAEQAVSEMRTAQAALEKMADSVTTGTQETAALLATIKRMGDENTQLLADLTAVQQQLAAAKEETRTAQAALEQLANASSDSTQRLDLICQAKEAAEAQAAQVAGEVERLTQLLSEVEARAASTEQRSAEAATSAAAQITTLTAQLAQLEKESTQLRTDLSVAQGAVASLADANDQNSDVDAELKRQLDAMTQERDAAQQRAAASAEELRTAAAALDRMVAESSAQAQQTASLSERVAQLEMEKAQLSAARDAAEQQASGTAEELRTAQAALETMATALADATQRAEAATAHNAELESDLAQRSAARDAATERADRAVAAEQASQAALEKLSEESLSAGQRADALASAHRALEAEVTRLQHALSAAEARVAEAERRSAETAAALEKGVAEHAAKAADLEAESRRLKEQLSIARTAVSSLADNCTEDSSQMAELKRQLEDEHSRYTQAESTVAALRGELANAHAAVAQLTDTVEVHKANDAAVKAGLAAQQEAFALLQRRHDDEHAELAEVRRRGEELQRLLDTTLDRLSQAEALVKELNDNAAELDRERAGLTEQLATAQLALETVVQERQDAQERLAAAQLGLEQTTDLYNERILEENRLQDELRAVSKAFAAQTEQVKAGIARVLRMSEGVHGVVTAVVHSATTVTQATSELATLSASQTSAAAVRDVVPAAPQDAASAVAAIHAAFPAWSAALEWSMLMQQRLRKLEASQVDGDGERANGTADASTSGSGQHAGNDVASNSAADAAASRKSDVTEARAAVSGFLEQQSTSLLHLHRVQQALNDRDEDLRLLRSALDTMASESLNDKERVDKLLQAMKEVQNRVTIAEKDFDEQLRLRSEAIGAELFVARRDEERAKDARLRAETQLEAVEAELRTTQAALRKLEEEKRQLTRETERLSRYSTRMVDASARLRGGAAGSVTPPLTALYAESLSTHYTMSSSAVEALEQAHLLQVSNLQQELMLCRRQVRELEGQETTLRQAYVVLEQEVVELRVEATEVEDLREERDSLRAENAEWEEKNAQLQRVMDATQRSTRQELTQLRQQVRVLETELEEHKTRLQVLMMGKTTPEFEALRRQEAFKENLSDITTQLAATQAQYSGGGSSNSSNANAAASSPQSLYNTRIEHLQTAVQERDLLIEKLQAEKLQARVTKDSVEEKLSEKAAALARMSELNAQYLETIEALRSAGVSAATRAATPRRNTDTSLLSRSQGDAVPPPTPLSLQASASGEAQRAGGHNTSGIAMPSPAPRMPNLDDVAAEDATSEAEAEATATSPATARRRTGAVGEGSRSSRGRGRKHQEARSASSGSTSPLQRSPRASLNAEQSASRRKRGR